MRKVKRYDIGDGCDGDSGQCNAEMEEDKLGLYTLASDYDRRDSEYEDLLGEHIEMTNERNALLMERDLLRQRTIAATESVRLERLDHYAEADHLRNTANANVAELNRLLKERPLLLAVANALTVWRSPGALSKNDAEVAMCKAHDAWEEREK